MPARRRQILLLLLLLFGAAWANFSGAAYPSQPIKLVVGFAPGGQSTTIARIVADRLTAMWEQSVVIDYRSGASGTIAADHVAKAHPDGYTLLLVAPANMTLASVLNPSLPYDPNRDFEPVGGIVHTPYALAVRQSLPVRTVQELVEYARANPGRLNFGSTGYSSQSLLAAQIFACAAGIDMVEIPYKGTAQAVADLVAGHIDLMFTDLPQLGAPARAGTLRLIAATGSKRPAAAPDLPTLAEQGVPGAAIEPWQGLVAPDGTPPEVVAMLKAALIEMLRDPKVRELLLGFGFEPFDNSRQDLRTTIRTEIETYKAIGKRVCVTAPR